MINFDLFLTVIVSYGAEFVEERVSEGTKNQYVISKYKPKGGGNPVYIDCCYDEIDNGMALNLLKLLNLEHIYESLVAHEKDVVINHELPKFPPGYEE